MQKINLFYKYFSLEDILTEFMHHGLVMQV